MLAMLGFACAWLRVGPVPAFGRPCISAPRIRHVAGVQPLCVCALSNWE